MESEGESRTGWGREFQSRGESERRGGSEDLGGVMRRSSR